MRSYNLKKCLLKLFKLNKRIQDNFFTIKLYTLKKLSIKINRRIIIKFSKPVMTPIFVINAAIKFCKMLFRRKKYMA